MTTTFSGDWGATIGHEVTGTTLHPGTGAGPVVVLDAPLSFWGGTDAAGRVVDRHHPQHGAKLAGRVVAMMASRGSSSSSSVLAEQVRAGTAPAALLLAESDAVVLLGVLVASELYGQQLPVVLLDSADLAALPQGERALVEADTRVGLVRWGEVTR